MRSPSMFLSSLGYSDATDEGYMVSKHTCLTISVFVDILHFLAQQFVFSEVPTLSCIEEYDVQTLERGVRSCIVSSS